MGKKTKKQSKTTSQKLITLDDLRKDPAIQAYIKQADIYLGNIGYTEHGTRHANIVAERAFQIMKELGYPQREAELAAIAGYLHDIGNVICRHYHSQIGAILSLRLLERLGMDFDEIATIIGIIGSHDDEEDTGEPISHLSAAVIIADKSDVHHTRVRNPKMIKFDIHDRVNYAVRHSELVTDAENKLISLKLTIDTSISQVMEYFEIFLSRMIVSRKSAQFLGCDFALEINKVRLL